MMVVAALAGSMTVTFSFSVCQPAICYQDCRRRYGDMSHHPVGPLTAVPIAVWRHLLLLYISFNSESKSSLKIKVQNLRYVV